MKNGRTNTHANDQVHYFISRKSWAVPNQNRVTHFWHFQNSSGFPIFSVFFWPLRLSVYLFFPRHHSGTLSLPYL